MKSLQRLARSQRSRCGEAGQQVQVLRDRRRRRRKRHHDQRRLRQSKTAGLPTAAARWPQPHPHGRGASAARVVLTTLAGVVVEQAIVRGFRFPAPPRSDGGGKAASRPRACFRRTSPVRRSLPASACSVGALVLRSRRAPAKQKPTKFDSPSRTIPLTPLTSDVVGKDSTTAASPRLAAARLAAKRAEEALKAEAAAQASAAAEARQAREKFSPSIKAKHLAV